MAILLAFAPFIVFAVVETLAGPMEGLVAGALVSLSLLVRDWMIQRRSPKILEIGTALLFCGLVLYAMFSRVSWSGVRLCIDGGLLLIVLVSMAVGRPFTLQYAREQVAPEFWSSPVFVRTNYIITAIWAVAFAIMVLADLALFYVPKQPPGIGVIATTLALIGAAKFTAWYPERVRGRTTPG